MDEFARLLNETIRAVLTERHNDTLAAQQEEVIDRLSTRAPGRPLDLSAVRETVARAKRA